MLQIYKNIQLSIRKISFIVTNVKHFYTHLILLVDRRVFGFQNLQNKKLIYHLRGVEVVWFGVASGNKQTKKVIFSIHNA